MVTLLTESPEVAASFIRRGETAAFPTETVYGLGADAFDRRAVARIFEAKGRPSDNPLIVHVARIEALDEVAAHIPPGAAALRDTYFPGPLTLVLPKHPHVPPEVTANLETVAVRMPVHPVARTFLEACGTPVAAPSANRSGRPSPTTWEAVREDLDGRIACILKGDRSPVGLESTVVDCTGAEPVILRAGAITMEMMRTVARGVRLADPTDDAVARSPGTRHRHYSPRARVVLVAEPAEAVPAASAAYVGLSPPSTSARFGLVLVCTDVEAYAHELYHFFRRCDAAGIETIYCQKVPVEGVGRALSDRLQRAAE